MPKMIVQDFLDNEEWLIKKADKAVSAYPLHQRMHDRRWEAAIGTIDLKIFILENLILELKGLKKRLKQIKNQEKR